MKTARDLPQLLERFGELGSRRHQQPADLGFQVEALADPSQLQCQRDEPLLGAVVDVALEPPPLAVRRRDDLHAALRAAKLGNGGRRLEQCVDGGLNHRRSSRLRWNDVIAACRMAGRTSSGCAP